MFSWHLQFFPISFHESSNLSHSIVSLNFFALFIEEGLICLCYSLESAFNCVYLSLETSLKDLKSPSTSFLYPQIQQSPVIFDYMCDILSPPSLLHCSTSDSDILSGLLLYSFNIVSLYIHFIYYHPKTKLCSTQMIIPDFSAFKALNTSCSLSLFLALMSSLPSKAMFQPLRI